MPQRPVPEALKLAVPGPVLEVVVALAELGGRAWLVGEGLADLVRGQRPKAFQVCATAPRAAWLERFPRAVPTRPAEGIVMVPTRAGPVDVSSPRDGKDVLADLERRCFTIHALAWSPDSDEWLDPFDGQADLEAGLLRTVGTSATRLREDPIRSLRAIRIASSLGYRIDPELGRALRGGLPRLTPPLRLRVRRELTPLLLSPGAGAGIDLLRDAGLEERLVPGARPDSGSIVALLPPVLAVRLAAWLRGTNEARVLARLRFSRELAVRVQRLLRHHPIERAGAAPERALRRLDDHDIDALFALRRAEQSVAETSEHAPVSEASVGAASELDRLEERVREHRRAAAATQAAGPLALDGKQVMELLECGPGPLVGGALKHLAECVARDPNCNSEGDLRKRLKTWAQPKRESV